MTQGSDPFRHTLVTARDNAGVGLLYDSIGKRYTEVRREDPRIAARIRAALGDARTVVNVGAGTGSYEPADLEVVAVEPSETMIAQRPEGTAPVVRAFAEELPFKDGSFDAAIAVLTDHHWSDHARGLAEMRRVARRVVLFTWDPATVFDGWVVRDYFPAIVDLIPGDYRFAHTLARLGDARAEPVPVPHDCLDGFFHAYWRRPDAYLSREVRAGISVFARLDGAAVDAGVRRLRRDLQSGEWERRNGHLLELEELDLGYRLVTAPP
jgi:SAM-dependent methyltransferase